MINVYEKTEKEIENEAADYRWAASMVKGVPRRVCPTYLKKKDGTRVDTWDLTESEIISLFSRELAQNGKSLDPSVGSFIKSLPKNLKFSLDGVLEFLNLESKYGSVAADLMVSFCIETLNSARVIAKFNKECNGDYSNVIDQDLVAIVSQMKQNELNRNRQSSIRR